MKRENQKPKDSSSYGFEAVTTFSFVFDELSPQNTERKARGGFPTLQKINHYARILNHASFRGNSAVFEASVKRRNEQNSINFDLIGQYTRVCAINRYVFVQK